MEKNNDRVKYIERASIIGVVGNGLLSVLQLIVGFWGHSLALVGAGIDTVTDVVTSLVTLFTGRIVERPPDEQHPYGHGRAETIATKLLSFIIIFAGAQLTLSTIQHLISGEGRSLPNRLTLLVAALSIVVKIFLALVKWHAGKKANSSMLIADAKNMSMDVMISASVLLGLFFTIRLGMPILDTVLGCGVGLWIVWIGYGIFMDTNVELMDGLKNRDIYREVCRASMAVDGVCNPHKMRIRQFNTRYIIDMDIEVDGDLSVREGHELAMKVERNVHREVDNVYDVHIHVEPLGNEERKERFGISRNNLQNDGEETVENEELYYGESTEKKA
ncbi:MAG TPA: cation transporter [Sediminispirochaeta sp.]|nr:cation transporter [Sediminispirochaeta sp.]